MESGEDFRCGTLLIRGDIVQIGGTSYAIKNIASVSQSHDIEKSDLAMWGGLVAFLGCPCFLGAYFNDSPNGRLAVAGIGAALVAVGVLMMLLRPEPRHVYQLTITPNSGEAVIVHAPNRETLLIAADKLRIAMGRRRVSD